MALLRGLNVGSHNRVAMADLRELMTGLGYQDVRTHLQSAYDKLGVSDRAAAVATAIRRGILV